MIVQFWTIIYAGLVTPPLLPLCEDCDQAARAPRSRRCIPCREARKATQKATWQRENRDKRRADTRPILVTREAAAASVAELLASLTSLQPLRSHLLARASSSRLAREALTALESAFTAMENVTELLSYSSSPSTSERDASSLEHHAVP